MTFTSSKCVSCKHSISKERCTSGNNYYDFVPLPHSSGVEWLGLYNFVTVKVIDEPALT